MNFIDKNKPKILNLWLMLCIAYIIVTTLNYVAIAFLDPGEMSTVEFIAIAFLLLLIDIYFVQRIYQGTNWARIFALVIGIVGLYSLITDETILEQNLPLVVDILNWVTLGVFYLGLVLLFMPQTNKWFKQVNND